MRKIVILLSIMIMSSNLLSAQTAKEIKLDSPDLKGGKPLMQALNNRSSSREFSNIQISKEHLSNLLWAACGINRPELNKRTAPSSNNWQDITVYVSIPDGIYQYVEKEHKLVLVKEGDFREATGKQEYVGKAPLNLIYVSNYDKMAKASDKDKEYYSAFDAGFIAQNVYLFCASEGLNTVVRAYVDKEKLHEIMSLNENQHIVGCQTVGYAPSK